MRNSIRWGCVGIALFGGWVAMEKARIYNENQPRIRDAIVSQICKPAKLPKTDPACDEIREAVTRTQVRLAAGPLKSPWDFNPQ